MSETVFGIVVIFFFGACISFFVAIAIMWLIQTIDDFREHEEKRKKRGEKTE